jgi:putative ABC transport system substrate-binding protein
MKRRALIAGAIAGVAADPSARAQSPGRIYRLAYLTPTAESIETARRVILPELERQGFTEGRNLVFDARSGAADALPEMARELVARRPDVMVTVGSSALHALSAVTRTIPIVAFGPDPTELGLAAGLSRPAGNVTGIMIPAVELNAKRLQLMLEAAPDRRRVAVLYMASQPNYAANLREMDRVATAAGIELVRLAVAGPGDYVDAFAAMRAAGAQGLVILSAPEFDRNIKMLIGLARGARLPAACEWASHASDGCLLGYGPDRNAMRLRLADQIVRILRGTAPGDLPIEVPARFELTINDGVARALGIMLPPTLLARADEVIE